MSSPAIWRTALRARPLRAPQSEPPSLSRRRLLAADVAADLVELVHRHEQPVAGLAALAGCVLDDEVLAGRAVHGAVDELDVASDAVLLVHDVVAGLELERVDLLAATRRHARALGPLGGALADEVVVGDDDQVAGRQHQSVAELAAQHLHDPGRSVGLERPGMSFSASHSTVRCACPWPGTTMTTRRPAASQPRMSASAASVSPR